MTSSTCGVCIQTWGTKYGVGNGMLHYLDSKMFGGNVGHAAIILTIPANAEGDALIAKYCRSKAGKKIIPYAKKSLNFADGSQEDIYEIRFSWWPPRENKKVSLEDDVNIDRKDGRYGVDFHWSEEANIIFKPESRVYKGLLGKTVKRLGPLSVVHIRDLDENKSTIVKLTSELIHINESLDGLELILIILDKYAKNPSSTKATFSETETALFKNVIPEFDLEKFISDGAASDNIPKIKKHTEKKITSLSKKKKERQSEILKTKQQMQNEPRRKKLQDEIDSLKSKANKVFANYRMLKNSTNSGIFTQSDFDGILTVEEALDISFNNWKDYVENPDEIIAAEEVKVLLEILSKEAALIAKKIEDAEHELQEFNNLKKEFDNIEDYMTLGALEENTVTILIKTFPNSTVGVSNGLDYEAMLKQMNTLVTDNTKFDLQRKNCSETICKILEAGVQEPHLKEISKNRAWGAFGNPQMVYNIALRVQEGIINHERSSILRRVINFNPVERATGTLLKVMIDKKSSRSKKLAAGFLGIFVGALALCSAIIRSIFNPLIMFKTVYGLIAYAYSKESNTLKAVAMVVLGPILLTLVIPAAIQLTVITTIVTPIRNLFAMFSKKNHQSNLSDNSELTIKRKDVEHDLAINLNSKIIEIKEKTPEKAISKFISELQSSYTVIPIFSFSTLISIKEFHSRCFNLPDEIKTLIKTLPEDLRRSLGLLDIKFEDIPFNVADKLELTKEKFDALTITSKEHLWIDNILTIESLTNKLSNVSLQRVKDNEHSFFEKNADRIKSLQNNEHIAKTQRKGRMTFSGQGTNQNKKHIAKTQRKGRMVFPEQDTNNPDVESKSKNTKGKL